MYLVSKPPHLQYSVTKADIIIINMTINLKFITMYYIYYIIL